MTLVGQQIGVKLTRGLNTVEFALPATTRFNVRMSASGEIELSFNQPQISTPLPTPQVSAPRPALQLSTSRVDRLEDSVNKTRQHR